MRPVDKWRQIPRPVKDFLWKGTVLFIAWKILYLAFLLPSRLVDRPLTHLIAAGTVRTLHIVAPSSVYPYSMVSGVDTLITRNGTILKDEVEWIYRGPFKTLSIADVCNGLELMVLYAGFLLCWPAGSVRKIKFIAGGFLLIVLLNILRCAALALISVHKPQYVDFYHHYLFTFLIYGCIFLLWYLFTLDPVVSQKRLQHVPTGK